MRTSPPLGSLWGWPESSSPALHPPFLLLQRAPPLLPSCPSAWFPGLLWGLPLPTLCGSYLQASLLPLRVSPLSCSQGERVLSCPFQSCGQLLTQCGQLKDASRKLVRWVQSRGHGDCREELTLDLLSREKPEHPPLPVPERPYFQFSSFFICTLSPSLLSLSPFVHFSLLLFLPL